jgi:hypothetical protein
LAVNRGRAIRVKDMKRKGNDLNIVGSAKISLATTKLWEQRVACALRDLGNRSALNQNPLARLAYIESLAQENYRGRLCPRGLALHNVLIECVDKVCQEVGNEPGLSRACNYLLLISKIGRAHV